MLNVASTGMHTILALFVNFKWNACKKWTSSLKLVVILAQCHYSEIAHKIFKHSNTQYISLTLDKKLNSSIYRTLFYVNIYGTYKLSKTVRFWPTLYMLQWHFHPSVTLLETVRKTLDAFTIIYIYSTTLQPQTGIITFDIGLQLTFCKITKLYTKIIVCLYCSIGKIPMWHREFRGWR